MMSYLLEMHTAGQPRPSSCQLQAFFWHTRPLHAPPDHQLPAASLSYLARLTRGVLRHSNFADFKWKHSGWCRSRLRCRLTHSCDTTWTSGIEDASRYMAKRTWHDIQGARFWNLEICQLEEKGMGHADFAPALGTHYHPGPVWPTGHWIEQRLVLDERRCHFRRFMPKSPPTTEDGQNHPSAKLINPQPGKTLNQGRWLKSCWDPSSSSSILPSEGSSSASGALLCKAAQQFGAPCDAGEEHEGRPRHLPVLLRSSSAGQFWGLDYRRETAGSESWGSEVTCSSGKPFFVWRFVSS